MTIDSEEGEGRANFVGHIIYFLHNIGYESRIFLKAKRNKHTLKRGGGGGVVVEVQ